MIELQSSLRDFALKRLRLLSGVDRSIVCEDR